MNLLAAIRVALVALRVNALRTALAMLGVIIGVSAVIVMVSVTEGAKAAVEEQIASFGANLLIIRPGSSAFGGRHGGAGTATFLNDEDVNAIATEIDGVLGASGEISGNTAIVVEGENWTTRVQGVHAAYFETRDWFPAEGRPFYPEEVNSGARVVVLGQTVVEELFGASDPIGQTVRLGSTPMEVIGVMSEKGQSSWGSDQDDVVLVPVTTARDRILGYQLGVRDPVFSVYAEVSPTANPDIVTADIEDLMRIRRDIQPGAEDDFNVRNLGEFIRARNETENQLGLLLAAAAAISLLVGGIGIMNIMLVSTTERTREIGLRLAVGAKRADIRNQFLIESVMLCFTGGLIGLAIGVGAAAYIDSLDEFPVQIQPTVALIAIGASAFVGVFFGFYPAHRASRLDPIEALRFE
ncbi:ABC transporter permease [Hyphobacterium sp. HN65]|uniref:ABC transporter permease n=1 Tax=Hyphobacterium lacteum TaxID=3116575 RepID=A0ABU7LNE2_9PROT|nr:ABC transporter permease [Hyphobacterium sp. HN65]MEE2525446.1 ABC transporter permease [Hyphobacterium sp. HN65]